MTDQIICHADGDRCLGCAHYRGEADVCEFAPRTLKCPYCGHMYQSSGIGSVYCGPHRSPDGDYSPAVQMREVQPPREQA